MKRILILLALLQFSETILCQVTTQQVLYNYQIAYCVGAKNATAWIGDDVVIMIEAESAADRNMTTMTQVIDVFEDVIAKYEEFTGLTNLPMASQFNGKPVIEVVLDNCGAGGLASHGVLGMSTGVSFFDEFYNLVTQGNIAMPQVFLYELNRNFWKPSFNNKFDWAMNNDIQNWGWWTVGMNNAQAYIIPKSLGIGLYYFGNDINYWENRMVGELNDYMNDTQYDFDFGWRQSLMPWHNTESINDLMSGLLIYSYNNFGGDAWIKGFYQHIENVDIPNRPDVFAYQECRDNVYKIWSYAANQDLVSFFENDLRWVISQSAKNCVVDYLNTTSITNVYVDNQSIIMYPCPTDGIFTIEGNFAGYDIQIMDDLGQVHQTLNNMASPIHIDLNSLPNGLYFVVVTNQNNQSISIQQIIKN